MNDIRTLDPWTWKYSRDYANGYAAGERCADGALDRADGRNVSHAWYDGYHDSAAGRPKWTYRAWRRKGCDSVCGYDCGDGPHVPEERLRVIARIERDMVAAFAMDTRWLVTYLSAYSAQFNDEIRRGIITREAVRAYADAALETIRHTHEEDEENE